MPRLGHKKSRLGCRQCKSRHVKCDELKPCSNCARHGVLCSLVMWDPTTPQPSTPATFLSSSNASPFASQRPNDSSAIKSLPTLSSSLHIDYVLNPSNTSPGDRTSNSARSEGSSPASQLDHFPFLSKFIHRPEATQSDIWLRDLELMHHWTIEAFDDLSQRDDMRHTWRVDAPKHAFGHPFLMHEILAFSAFHKAYKQPDQQAEYYGFGIHHQDCAIRGIREKLQDVAPAEAAPIFATSTLLTLSIFASTGFEAKFVEPSTSQSPIDGILNIFSLMQGMANVFAMAQGSVKESFLAPMFRDSLEAVASQPMLQELVQHIPTLKFSIEGHRDLSELERSIYLDAIAHFEPPLQVATPLRVDNRELRFLFFWPLHLESSFLAYVRQRHSGALVILMHYTTMLFASESRYWFMEGWGNRLMEACYDAVDQSWMAAIQWPVSFLNQTSTYETFANFVRQKQAPEIQAQPQCTHLPVPIPHRQQLGSTLSHAYMSLPSYTVDTSSTTPTEDQKPSTGN